MAKEVLLEELPFEPRKEMRKGLCNSVKEGGQHLRSPGAGVRKEEAVSAGGWGEG